MAAKGGGKIKDRRTQLTTKPYQRRKSLFGKVTDTVKELLAPSWLSDLVSSVKQKTDSDEEVEDEIYMSPAQSPSELPGPPNKSVHMVSKPVQQPKVFPGNGIPQYTKQEPSAPVSQLKFPGAGVTPTFDLSFQPGNHLEKRGHLCSKSSGPSGPSVPPLPDKPAAGKTVLTLTNLDCLKDQLQFPKAPEQHEQTMTSSITQTQTRTQTQPQTVVLPKDRGLVQGQGPGPGHVPDHLERIKTWSASVTDSLTNSQPTRHSMRSKPAFNISLFGSPLNNTSLLSENFHESSFYPGKTTYGGSSSHRKSLNVTAPYQTALPTRRAMKTKQLNQSVGAVTSTTAKRILDTLERMSTPLSDAKKIPNSISSRRDSFLSYTPSTYRRQARHSIGSSLSRSADFPPRGPPINRINTTSYASISKNRQSVSAYEMDDVSFTERPAKRSEQLTNYNFFIGISNRVESYETPISVGGKMKREKSYHNPNRKPDEDVLVMPDLNTEFTLPPLRDMPKFSFENSVSTSKSGITPSSKPISSQQALYHSNPDTQFTFSSPLQTTSSHNSKGTIKSDFKFSSPIRLDEESGEPMAKVMNMKNSLKSETVMTTGIYSVAPRPKLSSVSSHDDTSECINPPKTTVNLVNCDINQNSPLKGFKSAGGVLSNSPPMVGFQPTSVRTNNSDNSASPGGPKPANQLKTGSVMDILNKSKETSDTSGALKPAQELKKGSVMDILGKGSKPEQSSDLKSMFEKPSGSWTCDVCLVPNNPSQSKCVACQSAKPGSKPQQTNDLKVVQPAGNWTCDVCLVPNNQSQSKCVACQSAKPGNKPKAAGDTSLMSKFKKPEGEWNCDTCLVNNKAGAFKCIACESPRPGTQSYATGAFKIQTSPVSSSSAFTTGGFKFGDYADDQGSSPFVSSVFGKNTSESKTSDSQGSGFVFGKVESDKKSDSTSGFTFGEKSGEKKVSDTAGSGFISGFKFGEQESIAQQSSDSKISDTEQKSDNISGFKFGQPGPFSKQNSDKNSDEISGFKFGQQDSFVQPTSDSKSAETTGAGLVVGRGGTDKTSESASGLKFGQQESTSKTNGDTALGFSLQTGIKSNNAALPAFSFGGKSTPTDKPTSIQTTGLVFGVPQQSSNNSQSDNVSFKSIKTTAVDNSSIVASTTVTTATSLVSGGLGQTSITGLNKGVNSTESGVKPITFGSTDSNKPNFQFGTSDSKILSGDVSKPVFGASSTESSKPLFMFGQNNPKTASSNSEGFGFTKASSKAAESIQSNSGLFVFGGQGANKDTKPLGVASPVTFGATPSTSSTPVFGTPSSTPTFGLPVTTTSSQGFGSSTTGFSSGFGNPQTSDQTVQFGNGTSTAAPAFGGTAVTSTTGEGRSATFGASPFGATPASAFGSTSTSVFGGAAPATAGGGFGQNLTTPVFGATAPASSVFGGTSGTTPSFGGSSATPTFGAPPTTTASTGFNFAAGSASFNFNASSNLPAQGSVFQFGAQPTPGSTAPTAQPQQPTPSTGGFPQPQQPTPSAVGFSQSQQQPASTGGFPQPQPASTGGFNFGQAAPTPAQGGFNFTTVPGAFNFSGTSTPGDRKIKKAVRKIKR
ncbi:hypothetical protein ScPMuIL_007113 [Solemya velum]